MKEEAPNTRSNEDYRTRRQRLAEALAAVSILRVEAEQDISEPDSKPA